MKKYPRIRIDFCLGYRNVPTITTTENSYESDYWLVEIWRGSSAYSLYTHRIFSRHAAERVAKNLSNLTGWPIVEV